MEYELLAPTCSAEFLSLCFPILALFFSVAKAFRVRNVAQHGYSNMNSQ